MSIEHIDPRSDEGNVKLAGHSGFKSVAKVSNGGFAASSAL